MLFHVGSGLGNQAEGTLCVQLVAERTGNIPSVGDERAKQVAHQADHRSAVIDIAGGQPPVEHLALIIADQMELEAEKPSGRAFAPLGKSSTGWFLPRL